MKRGLPGAWRVLRAIGAASFGAAILLAPGCGRDAGEGKAVAESALAVEGIPEEHPSKAVAIVNGVTIYSSTYEEILQVLRNRIQPGDTDSVERYLGAKLQALEKAIDEELLYQEAARRGFDPTTKEIRSAYARTVSSAGSEEVFLAQHRSRNVSKSEVLQAIRRTLALERFVKEEVESTITPTDAEVRAFYDSRPDLFTPDPSVKVAQIFVKAPREAPAPARSAALSRISLVYDKLRQGRTFESLAQQYSEDRSASRGGLLGFFGKGTMPERLEQAAFALEPGGVSDIIESENGYHILKVHERKGGALEPFDKIKDDARLVLFQKRRGQALSAIVRDLRTSATIERLAG